MSQIIKIQRRFNHTNQHYYNRELKRIKATLAKGLTIAKETEKQSKVTTKKNTEIIGHIKEDTETGEEKFIRNNYIKNV